MGELDAKHINVVADQLKKLLTGKTREIAEAFAVSEDDEGYCALDISLKVKIVEILNDKYEIKTAVSFHPAAIKDSLAIQVDDRQLGLFGAIDNLVPKKGSGIDSVTFSSPAHEPVTLEAQ